jgi:hypothetical protein
METSLLASLIIKILLISFGLSVNQIRGILSLLIFLNIRFLNLIFSLKDSGLKDNIIRILVIRL